ncbi:hypothetical protein FJ419_25165 [Mesorhizobium sp. B2-6-2]|nr:hypothetical protein FJ419_25165 [Mesorhizobium sp. B2-6-2]
MGGQGQAWKLPISPLVGEMPGRAEGGAKERGVLRFMLAERSLPEGSACYRLICRRDSAPLWPAGHLPHEGGDQALHRLRPSPPTRVRLPSFST